VGLLRSSLLALVRSTPTSAHCVGSSIVRFGSCRVVAMTGKAQVLGWVDELPFSVVELLRDRVLHDVTSTGSTSTSSAAVPC